MSRLTQSLPLAALVLLAACNVTKDPGNESTTLSVDSNRIENGADALIDEAANVAAEAGKVIENAGPEIEQSAATIRERAGRVADKAEALGNRIEARTDGEPPAVNSVEADKH